MRPNFLIKWVCTLQLTHSNLHSCLCFQVWNRLTIWQKSMNLCLIFNPKQPSLARFVVCFLLLFVPSAFLVLFFVWYLQDDHSGGRPGEVDGFQRAGRVDIGGLQAPQWPAAPAPATHAGRHRLLGGHHHPGGAHAETGQRLSRWEESDTHKHTAYWC